MRPAADQREPRRLRWREVLLAWATLLTGLLYTLRRSRDFRITLVVITVTVTGIVGPLSGWEAFVTVALLYAAVISAVVLLTPGVVLLVYAVTSLRRVWVAPGARAVVLARRTREGWSPRNASARPVGHGLAAPLLTQVCAYADATGAVLEAKAANLRVARLYQDRYGCHVDPGSSRQGKPHVTRAPRHIPTEG